MSPQKINLTVEYRSKPAYKWVLVEPLGKMAGGLNSGINLVRTTTPNAQASKLLFIEKRFRPTDFKHKVPYREIQMLHQLGDHPNITTMIDHFIDEKTLTGSVYLELCDMGNMAEVVAAVANGNFVNEHKVWNWFIQVTEALVYCHWGSRPEMTADELLQSGWSKVYHRDISKYTPSIVRK
ncbi:hypothetical protein EJ02DRAFT_453428 [Clathrospora elynae]|uniref:non-specific serine/threonine protein kinase n=1 Tax=Clathrospora elynae TaxID=706981 RepID=A0A6A5SUH3_9PLEO|nr:hypothetical protein EJ02DRAFT_453428 [Clathrospora elynae]